MCGVGSSGPLRSFRTRCESKLLDGRISGLIEHLSANSCFCVDFMEVILCTQCDIGNRFEITKSKPETEDKVLRKGRHLRCNVKFP